MRPIQYCRQQLSEPCVGQQVGRFKIVDSEFYQNVQAHPIKSTMTFKKRLVYSISLTHSFGRMFGPIKYHQQQLLVTRMGPFDTICSNFWNESQAHSTISASSFVAYLGPSNAIGHVDVRVSGPAQYAQQFCSSSQNKLGAHLILLATFFSGMPGPIQCRWQCVLKINIGPIQYYWRQLLITWCLGPSNTIGKMSHKDDRPIHCYWHYISLLSVGPSVNIGDIFWWAYS